MPNLTADQINQGRNLCQIHLSAVATYHATFAAYKAVCGAQNPEEVWEGPQKRATWASVALDESRDRLASFVAHTTGRELDPGDAAALRLDGHLVVIVEPVDDSERGPHFGQLSADEMIELGEEE